MATILSTHAQEEKSYIITLTFTEGGVGYTPTTLTWTLSDMDGHIVNGRAAVAATAAGTTQNVVLGGTDTSIIAGQTNERMFLAEWTYDSAVYGSDLAGGYEAIFVIDNLLKVT